MAESALDGPGAMRRAIWQAKCDVARGTQAWLIVPGWGLSDCSLWWLDRMVAVKTPPSGFPTPRTGMRTDHGGRDRSAWSERERHHAPHPAKRAGRLLSVRATEPSY